MCAAFYLADFCLQWERGGSRGSARHYIPRSPCRQALMEDGLSLKAAQGGRSRARRGECGGAGGLGRLPDRSPAGGARCCRGWTPLPASGGAEASPRAGHSPEAAPAPESVGEGPHGRGGCETGRGLPAAASPRSGAAAVGAICRRRPTPRAFRGREGEGAGFEGRERRGSSL